VPIYRSALDRTNTFSACGYDPKRYPQRSATSFLLPKNGAARTMDREDKVDDAYEESRRRLVALVDEAPDELWSWLVGPESHSESPSAEYVALTCLTMAADSARLKLGRP